MALIKKQLSPQNIDANVGCVLYSRSIETGLGLTQLSFV
jgi:hypothetical protein